MSTPIYSVKWNEYIKYCYKLALCLKKYVDDRDRIAIITMPRGGYIPSSIIANQLDISRIYSCGYQSYVGKKQKEHIIYQNLPNAISKLRTIFLIDDIIDTSKTISNVMNIIRRKNPYSDLTICVASIFVKNKSRACANFYIKEVPDEVWVKFPYDN